MALRWQTIKHHCNIIQAKPSQRHTKKWDCHQYGFPCSDTIGESILEINLNWVGNYIISNYQHLCWHLKYNKISFGWWFSRKQHNEDAQFLLKVRKMFNNQCLSIHAIYHIWLKINKNDEFASSCMKQCHLQHNIHAFIWIKPNAQLCNSWIWIG